MACVTTESSWAYENVCPQHETTPEPESINALMMENLMLKQQEAQIKKKILTDVWQPINRTAGAPHPALQCPTRGQHKSKNTHVGTVVYYVDFRTDVCLAPTY